MLRNLLKSKIHNATVTGGAVEYEGSITIDSALLKAADIWEHEQVLVVDNTNGQRVVTYAIAAPANSGTVFMNGAAALLIKKGDEVIIMAFAQSEKPIKPKIVIVDRKNRIAKIK